MSSSKKRVAVVFGGRNTEHTVSCLSAASVLQHIDTERFEIVPIGITRDGGWVLGTSDYTTLQIQGNQLPVVDDGKALVLSGDPTTHSVISLEPGTVPEVLTDVDVVFPVLHGAFGEDGTIQGLLELANIPYVGPGVFASAAAMDKEFAKKLLAADGLSVGEYVVLRRGQSTLDDVDKERLGLPVFVKPSRAGSSVGISKVLDWQDLPAAIALARETDPKVLIEKAVIGREIECGVLEFPDGRVEASVPLEIRMVDEDPAVWYDFDAKYIDSAAQLDIPAKLDENISRQVREMAVKAFYALDCQGLARVDFFLSEDNELIINEVNTMPGMTDKSHYPKVWEASGMDYRSLLSVLVDTAVARGTGLR